ncbi:portal protein, partial [Salmonella enterica subsp. enterica serovar Kentucky]|nr:portal protein [Salmonella enterica subsp. enterica serovar Kentucky]
MKQQNRAEILELLGKTPQGTPEYQLLLLQYFTLLDGKGVEMMRDYANKQLIQMGVKKPETPEEQQWLVEAQQAKQGQQDPAMVQAQGVLLQGQAELAKAQNQTLSLQIDAAKVEAQNQLNAARIAEIFNNMDLNKQSEFREFLKTVASFQQDRSED